MSGTVGIIAQDQSRYSMFWHAIMALQRPVNTQMQMSISSDRILGRNSVCKLALEAGTEWILFLDDDQTFNSNLLLRLLSHDKPVVGALYTQRSTPFLPIAFSKKNRKDVWIPLRLEEHGPEDVVEVGGLGTGGMLIRSEVLHALEYPWFEHGRASEDLLFCDKVNEAGLGPIYCDLGARMGHFGMASVWPHYDVGREEWQTGVIIADGQNVTLPLYRFTDEEMEGIEPDAEAINEDPVYAPG